MLIKKSVLVVLVSLLIIGSVEAFDFDNVRSYDRSERTITITNALGLGHTIAEYTLLENTDECLIDCYAIGESKLYDDKTLLFTEIDFKDKRDNSRNINYNVYLESTDCEDITKQNFTYSLDLKIKTWVNNYTVEECTTDWKKYKGNALKSGMYKWKIEAKKDQHLNIDWIASAQGEKFTEWAWWNTSWNYKKQLNITSVHNVNDYATQITVTYDSDMNSDFSDLRFTNSAEDTELSYYLQGKIDSTNATIWVKSDLIIGNTSLYMYYSNAGASSKSNGTQTFLFFDDFSSNLDKWSDGGGAGNLAISGGKLNITGQEAGYSDSWSDYQNISYLSNWRASATDSHNQLADGTISGLDAQYMIGIRIQGGDDIFSRQPIWNDLFTLSQEIGDNSEHLVEITKNVNNYTVYVDENNAGSIIDSTHTSWTYLRLYQPTSNGLFDNITIRKDMLVEPTFNFAGEETTGGISITLNTPSNNTLSAVSDITFNCSATSPVNLTNIVLYIDEVKELNQTFTNTNDTSISSLESISDGSHNWTCEAFDLNFDAKTTHDFFFRVDTLFPEIEILFPENNQNYTSLTTLNFTFTEANPNTCWYSLDNGETNTTTSCFNNVTGLSSNQGTNTWIIFINDTIGNENSSSSTFSVDSIPPLISYTLNTPSNNTNTTSDSFLVEVSITESNFENVTFLLSNSTSVITNTFTDSTRDITYSNLNEATYIYNVTSCDTSSNCNSTETRVINIDTTAPNISFGFDTASTVFRIDKLASDCGAGAENVEKTFIINVRDNVFTSINCNVSVWNNVTNNLVLPNGTNVNINVVVMESVFSSTVDASNQISNVTENTTAPVEIICYDGAGNINTFSTTINYNLAWTKFFREDLSSVTGYTGGAVERNELEGSNVNGFFRDGTNFLLDDNSTMYESRLNKYFRTDYCGNTDRRGVIFYNNTIQDFTFTEQSIYFRKTAITNGDFNEYNLYYVNYTDNFIFELIITINQELYDQPIIIGRNINGIEYFIHSAFPTGQANQVKAYLIGNQQYNIYGFVEGSIVLLDTIILTSADSVNLDIPSFTFDIVNPRSKTLSFYENATESNDTFNLILATLFEGTGYINARIVNSTGFEVLNTSSENELLATTQVNVTQSGDTYQATATYPDGEEKIRTLVIGGLLPAFASVFVMSLIFILVAVSVGGSFVTRISYAGFVIAGVILILAQKGWGLPLTLSILGWIMIILGGVVAIMVGGRK